ncbi:hypothetical protein R1flu_017066 [Riccia fluitans]|uniref:Transmembrane protein n=1 Tax=Riccia fluitans TaxID=41844 RepID=A0ABD1YPF8_9MARC
MSRSVTIDKKRPASRVNLRVSTSLRPELPLPYSSRFCVCSRLCYWYFEARHPSSQSSSSAVSVFQVMCRSAPSHSRFLIGAAFLLVLLVLCSVRGSGGGATSLESCSGPGENHNPMQHTNMVVCPSCHIGFTHHPGFDKTATPLILT